MSSEKSLKATTFIRVRFHECDPLQIVWHGNYLKYFEEGREDFCSKNGISYLQAKEHGFSTPIVKSVCEHKLPLHYGDVFEVETTFVNSLAAKMIFSYKIFKTGNLVSTGQTTQVFLDARGELSIVNPPFFQDWKTKMGLI